MNWFDQMLQGFGVPNIAGEQNKALANNPTVQAARGPNGSFDTTRLGASLGAEGQEGLDFISQLYGMQGDAIKEATKPPTRTGVQWLGDALSAASVPVAYAQGNESYGSKMAGRTGADTFNERVRTYEDEARKQQLDLTGKMAGSMGEYGLDVLKGKREKVAEGRKQISAMLSAAMVDGKFDPASLKQIKLWADTNGFRDIWNEVQGALPIEPEANMGADDVAQPAAMPAPSMPAPAGAPPGMTGGGPGLPGLSAMAGNLPGAQRPAQAAAAPAVDKVSETPPAPSKATQALIQRANMLALTNPEAGKLAKAQAEASYKAELDVWKTKLDDQAGRGKYGTSNSVWFENSKTKQRRVGQLATGGGARISPFLDAQGNPIQEEFNPADWRQIDPAELAGNKSASSAAGRARGEAASGVPQANQVADQMLRDIDALMKDPGLSKVVGMDDVTGLIPKTWLPNYSSGARSAGPRIDQIAGKAFLVAFQQLKGAGQITEMEGDKAQKAITRLNSTDMDMKDYQIALQDAKIAIEEMRQLAIQKAQQGLIDPDATSFKVSPTKEMYLDEADGMWKERQIGRTSTSSNPRQSTGRISVDRIERID